MTDEDKANAKDSLIAKKAIDIDTARSSVRIAFADKSSKLARKTLDAFKEQVVGLVNLCSDHLMWLATGVPAPSRRVVNDRSRATAG